MQYKIPVQIENEDPIMLGLSLRQLVIIMVGGWISYSIFKGLVPSTGPEVAAIPGIILFLLTLFIALFKQYEMTFVPFVLALLRFNVNAKTRIWTKGVDSFSPLDIWYITTTKEENKEKIDFSSKIDKIQSLDEQLKNI